jgi:hypothetical protein
VTNKIYVILPSEAIGELLDGTRTELAVFEHAPVGSIVAVKTRRNRRPSCLLTVTNCEADEHGYVLTVKQCPMPDTIRLLGTAPPGRPLPRCPICRGDDVLCGACNGTGRSHAVNDPTDEDLGYTSQRWTALPDEPEGVSRADQDRIAAEGWTGFKTRESLRLAQRRRLALEERLRLAWADGQRLNISLSADLRAIERIVASMERKTDQSQKAA